MLKKDKLFNIKQQYLNIIIWWYLLYKLKEKQNKHTIQNKKLI